MATPNIFKFLKKKHVLPICLLIILTLVPLHDLLSSSEIIGHTHYTDSTFFLVKSIEKHLFEYHSFPLWSPFEYSGVPLLGHPETFLVSLPLLLLFVLKSNTILIINLTIVISFFIAGVGMYFLSYAFRKDTQSSLISAVVFMFNPAVFIFGLYGNISVFVPLSLMPFALLFTHKAMTGKDMILFSLLTGAVLALQIHAGGMIMFLYTFTLISGYLVFTTLGKNIAGKVIKAFLILAVITTFTLGLGAIKLLPTFEFQESSSRVAKFSYDEFLGGDGHYIKSVKELFPNFVKGKRTLSVSPQFGVVSVFLILASASLMLRKKVLFLFLIVFFTILIASNTFLTRFVYEVVPFFGNLKNIDRILVLVALSGSLLAGYGFKAVSEQAKQIKQLNGKKIIFPLILGLLIIELVVFASFPAAELTAKNKNIELLNAIQDPELFRVHYFQTSSFDLSHVIGAHGKSSFILYDLGEITGGGTIWPRDLGQYLFLAGQQQSTRLWGLLNVKYITSTGPAQIPNTELVWNGSVCSHCAPDFREKKVTHLYQNKDYLPRAYAVENAILVLGENQDLVFSLLLHPLFNPQDTVVISSPNLGWNSLSEYDSVVLSTNPSPSHMQQLQNYHDQGGVVLPNIFESRNSISEEEIESLLNTPKTLSPVEILSFKANEILLNVENPGFVVLSEMFTLFPGWEAEINGKKVPLLKANGIITSVVVDEPGELRLSYHPLGFKRGFVISSLTFLVFVFLFSYLFYRKRLRKEKA